MKIKQIVFISLLGLITAELAAMSVAELPDNEKQIANYVLDLSGKELTSLDGIRNIKGFTSLRVLNLSDNQLSTLLAGIFNGLTSLQWLYLSNNQLSALPPGIFNGLTSLQGLYFYSNQLSSLPAEIFDGLTSLQWLYLDGNRLTQKQINPLRAAFQGRNIQLSVSEQKAPPILPNLTDEEQAIFSQLPEEDKQCAICLGTIAASEGYRTACPFKKAEGLMGHISHAQCLSDWLEIRKKTECPVCGRDIFTGAKKAQQLAQQMQTKKRLHVAQKSTSKKKKPVKVAKCCKKEKVAVA